MSESSTPSATTLRILEAGQSILPIEVQPPADLDSTTADAAATDSAMDSAIDQNSPIERLLSTASETMVDVVTHSQVLLAVVQPDSFEVDMANAAFCQAVKLAGRQESVRGLVAVGRSLADLLPGLETEVLRDWLRRQVAYRLLLDRHPKDSRIRRLLNAPKLVQVADRWLELWMRPGALVFESIAPDVQTLMEASTSLPSFESAFQLEWCQFKGQLLLEGWDVTAREQLRRLGRLLLNGHSILQPEKFREVGQSMRSLFSGDATFVLRTDGDRLQLTLGNEARLRTVRGYDLGDLRESPCLAAMQLERVTIVRDLATQAVTPLEQDLRDRGARSLLLIPLLLRDKAGDRPPLLMGLVGVASRLPDNFDLLDINRAELLQPSLAVALRQAGQSHFSNIHPAVEWKFLQEAERRSWGLPPQPIAFENVYPLYGISDIRGSSLARDRAIQTDLLSQFRQALAILDCACAAKDLPLLRQLRLDLQEYIHNLEGGVTVEAEVRGAQYLRENIEDDLDYLAGLDPATAAAVTAYRQACDNPHGAVYEARAEYDHLVSEINRRMRETWDRCQSKMQSIAPHYCDIESTDGIDHMIYAGSSIYPDFTSFHLRSLRYEQLRAVCACARMGFEIERTLSDQLRLTHLVLVQGSTVDILHDENTEKLFDVRGTRDTRYEIVKKRIDKARDAITGERITQPGCLTVVYATEDEGHEYQEYLRYLEREGMIGSKRESGEVESLQGANGLRFIRVAVLPPEPDR